MQVLTSPRKFKVESLKDKFYQLLPVEFSRKEAIEVAASLNIKSRTADKYLFELTPTLLVKNDQYGKYKKQTLQCIQQIIH